MFAKFFTKLKELLSSGITKSIKIVDKVGDFETQKLLIVAVLALIALLVLSMGACTVGWLI